MLTQAHIALLQLRRQRHCKGLVSLPTPIIVLGVVLLCHVDGIKSFNVGAWDLFLIRVELPQHCWTALYGPAALFFLVLVESEILAV